MKAYKNEIEGQGVRNAHIRDAVALCQLIAQMETEVIAIEEKLFWDELKVSSMLDKLRAEQALNKGASFPSIVAFGKNGALPHYIPTPETNLTIDDSSVLTIDSGGQYLDGTIDTTRAFHFGQPTDIHKKVYTLLLRGVADLASSVFPEDTTLQEMDFVLRRPLYQHGLEYGHGSTHGTGVFLGVHEQPGYYKDDDFGMRLENLVIVVPADVENLTSKKLLTFEPLTLVPYERKLIDTNYLDDSQIKWINNYHASVLKLVGAEMLNQKKEKLYKWLRDRTKPI
ncbi:hypothetical protein AAG570_002534 [Ranatra chinensis]|uniref:Uncharacterized protein n=1 Tax=Ranatra chinensis TaxID=642074 RepID=A0ABD0Y9W7_9HEMI